MDKFIVVVTIYYNKTKRTIVTSLLEAIRLHDAEPDDPEIFDLDIQVCC